MSQGNIRKKSYTSNFLIISNDIARSKDLTWDEKGLIMFLMSHDESWKLHKSNIHSWSANGVDSTRRIFDNLVSKGYIKSFQKIDSTNQFKGWEHVFDIDRFAEELHPIIGDPENETPDNGGVNTKNTNIQEYQLKEKKSLDTTQFFDFIVFVNSLFGRKYLGDATVKRYFKANLKEGWSVEDMKKAAVNVKQDKWHKDKNYGMCSPEYLIRPSNMNRFVNMGNAGVKGEMFDMSSEPTTVTDVFLHTPSGKYWKVYSADKQKYVCQKNGDFEYQDNGTKIKFEE